MIDNFGKYGRTIPLTKKFSNNNKLFWKYSDNFEKKPNLIENDRGKEFLNKNLTDILNKNNIESYSH